MQNIFLAAKCLKSVLLFMAMYFIPAKRNFWGFTTFVHVSLYESE